MLKFIKVYASAPNLSLHQRIRIDQKTRDVIQKAFKHPLNNHDVRLQRVLQLIDLTKHKFDFASCLGELDQGYRRRGGLEHWYPELP